jgi:hypothetical protein
VPYIRIRAGPAITLDMSGHMDMETIRHRPDGWQASLCAPSDEKHLLHGLLQSHPHAESSARRPMETTRAPEDDDDDDSDSDDNAGGP